MAVIRPYDDLYSWKGCCTTELADAQRYYQKWEVDKKIDDIVISGGGVTSGEVQTTIEQYTYSKDETNSLLTQYLSKLEANNMLANYTRVENTTLILNNENIT